LTKKFVFEKKQKMF